MKVDLYEEALAQDPDQDSLGLLSRFIHQKEQLEAQIETLESALCETKKALEDVTEKHIPDLMAELRLDSVTTDTGYKIKVVTEYLPSIKAENAEAAHDWLRDNGFGDLIKHDFKVSFGRGEEASANMLSNTLRAMGVGYSDKENVHWQTLRAFVKEQIQAGAPLPRDLFGVHEKNVAKVSK